MPLRDATSGENLNSVISRVVEEDYQLIDDSGQFFFDWREEIENEVFKIYLKGKDDNILGLLSLVDRPDESRIHLNLIEVGKDNIGKTKAIENIAGCLIAVACKIAFDRDYLGFVSLKPKNKLIELYQEKYGFMQFGRMLAVDTPASVSLINKYLYNEEE